MKHLELFCDGASRGNPGPAAYGFVILDGQSAIEEVGRTLGTTTNNVAEYTGVIEGLKRCRALGAESVKVHSDSELLVKQLQGTYKVKAAHLRPLFEQTQQLIEAFAHVELVHVRRELNARADALANKALDANS